MTHLVLARKWRPKKFADLVGQQTTVTILKNILATKRLHHAYLLTGTRGVGKTTIARIIAKALNCLNPNDNEPCCICTNCDQIDNGRYVDVIEIDAASNTGVDNIREVLENSQYAPTAGSYKIYIIDEVHMLSKSAFNAMLKTLEEPPAHIIFILATTDLQKIPVTILSRCLQLKLRNLSRDEIATHLAWILKEEAITYEDYALTLLGTSANGSMRDALSLTDQAIAFSGSNISMHACEQMLGISDDKSLIGILHTINTRNSQELVAICERLNKQGANLENILSQINETLFNISLFQLTGKSELTPELQELAQQITIQDCQLYFEISNLGSEQLRKVANKYPTFVMTLLRMLAFTLGSSGQKHLLVTNSNFAAQTTPTDSKLIQQLDKPDTRHTKLQAEQIPVTSATDTASQESGQLLQTQEYSLFDGNWLLFTQGVDYEKLAANTGVGVILKNSQMEKFANLTLSLQVENKFRGLVTKQCIDLIEKLLFEKYHCHYSLEFNFLEATGGSLKNHEASVAKGKQQQAEESIRNDPTIKDLIDNFSAKILPDSVKPII